MSKVLPRIEEMITTQTYKLEVVSPVHVGTGKELASGLDYIVEGKHTLLLDADKISSRFVNDPSYLDALMTKQARKYLADRHLNYDEITLLRLPGATKALTLREQIADVFGNPYLPGSSIKGAIRTALFQELFEKNKSVAESTIKSSYKWVENKLFAPNTPERGTPPNYDLGRVIRISDVTFKTDDLVVIDSKIINQGHGNNVVWKDTASRKNHDQMRLGTPVGAICIGTGAVSDTVRWSLDTKVLDYIKMTGTGYGNWLNIANAANKLAKKLAEHTLDYMDQFTTLTDDADAFCAFLEEDILEQALAQCNRDVDNGKPSFMIQMSWGGGWNAKTGFLDEKVVDLIRDEVPKQNRKIRELGKRDMDFPKTRKIADEGETLSSLGWVKITAI
jgi:CRISPR-associated protein Csm5